jgi:hypothetical protein
MEESRTIPSDSPQKTLLGLQQPLEESDSSGVERADHEPAANRVKFDESEIAPERKDTTATSFASSSTTGVGREDDDRSDGGGKYDMNATWKYQVVHTKCSITMLYGRLPLTCS